MSRPVRVAILGATGAVGKAMIETLLRRKFPFTTLKLLASARSAGQVVHIQGVPYTVEEATPEPLRISMWRCLAQVEIFPCALQKKPSRAVRL